MTEHSLTRLLVQRERLRSRINGQRQALAHYGCGLVSPAAIADRVGYSSQFHLSRSFKQHYGVTPRDYRAAFAAGVATRQGGLPFRHHRLRRYLGERAPGKVAL